MKILPWIKLTRPLNLSIIAATMYLVHWLISLSNLPNESAIYLEWKFLMVVLVMVFLAAAGNIINDYFDLRVDRINKPDKVLIGTHVKRRVAMISHQVLNGLAVSMGFFLAYDVKNFWLGLIPIAIATMLWWYSVFLKKKILVGNLTVALLIALVPVWAGLFEIEWLALSFDWKNNSTASPYLTTFMAHIILIASFAIFGFLLTVIREIQKDIEDIKGDTKVGYATLPIKYGVDNVKKILTVLHLITFNIVIYFAINSSFDNLFNQPLTQRMISLIILVLIPLGIGWYKTYRAYEKTDFHSAGNYTKLAMVGGLIFLGLAWSGILLV